MNIRKLAVLAMTVLIAAPLLSACQTNGNGTRGSGLFSGRNIGSVLGAGAGVAVGSQIGKGTGRTIAMLGLGAGGWLLGGEAGENLTREDERQMNYAAQRATTAQVGQSIAWENPRSGNRGSITPVRAGRDRYTGNYCREFQQTVTIGGKKQQSYGTACRQPDGQWKQVN